MTDWYGAHYAHDPHADNVFGREALNLHGDPPLQAWLAQGGRMTDFIRSAPFAILRQAQDEAQGADYKKSSW